MVVWFCQSALLSLFPIVLGVVGVCLATTDGPCPDACFCNTINHIVYCSRRGLSSIPSDVPDDAIQLNLNGNQFFQGTIRHQNFSRYVDLEHLYLSECSIDVIEVGTFEALTNLRWLDLSNNRLKVIEPETFRGLSLQHLFLNGNRNLVLLPDSFTNFFTVGLYLHDCSMAKVKPEVFRPLSTFMRFLWLNGNDMERIDANFRSVFAGLLHLRLGTNPLDCGCGAIWLKEFFDENTEIFKGSLPPSCLTPRKLRGRFFNEMSLNDLGCRAPQFANIDAHFEPEVTRLRCTASGQPVPVLYWTEPSGTSTKFIPSAEDKTSDTNEAVLSVFPSNREKRHHVTGSYICSASNDAGNVTVAITVPWTMTSQSNPVTVTSGAAMRVTEAETVRGRTVQFSVTDGWVRPSVRGSVPGLASESSRTSDQLDWNDLESRSRGNSSSVERLFSLAELAWAVTLTHFVTMTICLLVVFLFYTRRTRNKNSRIRRENRHRDASRGTYANLNFVGPRIALPVNRTTSQCHCFNAYKVVNTGKTDDSELTNPSDR